MTTIAIEQPTDNDLDVIHGTLSQTYWAPGIPREVVVRSCANSMCAIARAESGALVGFARLITDRATFAWVCDVFVLPQHQGQGIARGLVQAFREHPELQNLRRWMLGTKDAHGVYAVLGFEPIDTPERFMQIRNPAPWGTPTT